MKRPEYFVFHELYGTDPDLGTLLAKIKSLPKPLAGYVFSRNQEWIDRVLQPFPLGEAL